MHLDSNVCFLCIVNAHYIIACPKISHDVCVLTDVSIFNWSALETPKMPPFYMLGVVFSRPLALGLQQTAGSPESNNLANADIYWS